MAFYIKPLPSIEVLNEILTYDKNTGVLRWKKSGTGRRKDLIAGTISGDGYLNVSINHIIYRAHRICYVLGGGILPEGMLIDHKNRNRTDNRFDNLHAVTAYGNNRNMSKPKNNTSGYACINWNKLNNKWRVRFQDNRKMIEVGSFNDKNEAIKALEKAKGGNIEHSINH